MKEKISVIIPCYNVETFIDRLMKTIEQQTYGIENLEIILVNDASTDDTLEYLLAWERKYEEQVMVIDCEKNGGLGAARNIGTDAASGTYLAFIDSDDWIALNYFERLVDLIETYDADLVFCGHDRPREFENPTVAPLDEALVFSLEDEDVRKQFLFSYISYMAVWGRLYRTDFVKNNGLFFPEQIHYEDGPYTLMSYLKAKKIVMCKDILYHYYYNTDGIILSDSESRKLERLISLRIFYDQCYYEGLLERYTLELEYIFLHKYFNEVMKVMFQTFATIDYAAYCGMRAWLLAAFPNVVNNPYVKEDEENGSMMFLPILMQKFNMEQLEAFRKVYMKRIFHRDRVFASGGKDVVDSTLPTRAELLLEDEQFEDRFNRLPMLSLTEPILSLCERYPEYPMMDVYRYVIDREMILAFINSDI